MIDMNSQNRFTDVENKFMVTMGEGSLMYTLLCLKQLSNKDIFYNTGKYSHYFVITLSRV